MRRTRAHENRAPRLVVLKPFLHHHPAERMSDKNGHGAQATDDLVQVMDVIGHADLVNETLLFALAMPTQTEGMRFVTLLGEIGEEMLVPHPGAPKGTVYEEQRWVRGWIRGRATDNFQVHSDSTDGDNGRKSDRPKTKGIGKVKRDSVDEQGCA